MAKKDIFEVLHDITQPVVQSFNLELWGIDVVQAGKPMVRIYVDVPATLPANLLDANDHADDKALDEHKSEDDANMAAHSATVEQCARISRLVGLALEVEDIFSSAYVLEVSSPGLSRPFFKPSQMTAYVGDMVEIVLADFLAETEQLPTFAIKRKKFCGELLGVKDNNISLKIEHGGEFYPMDFMWDNIRKATRVHIFITPEKPGKKRKNT